MMTSKILLPCSLLILLTFVASPSFAQREITPEAKLFQTLRDGVFTIYGDTGHGSGFLIDREGLILTNDHVVSNSMHLRVQINDSVKVAAKILASDARQDIAVLRVNADITAGLPVLSLADRIEDLAYEGERVIAIGSPLNQIRIVTSGIISSVNPDVIISDVTINEGNSGGPLINMDGEVIAVNTFKDVSQTGAGIAGSIVINQARDLIREAQDQMTTGKAPSADLLPVMPRTPYPLWALEHIAKMSKRDTTPYQLKSRISTRGGTFADESTGDRKPVARGGYFVTMATPPHIYWERKKFELKATEKRRKREERGGAGSAESYDPFEDLKDWFQYSGGYTPTVMISVAPEVGRTTSNVVGSIFSVALVGVAPPPELEFKADLKNVILKIDGIPQEEIKRGMSYLAVSGFGSDLARAGNFVFPHEIFAPGDDGWPRVTLEVYSIDKPDDPMVLMIPERTLQQIWVDFEPFRESLEAEEAELVVG